MTLGPSLRQTLDARLALPRHRHARAYAAVVLAGGYEEAGDAGRRRLSSGDVVLHGPYEAHLDRTGGRGAQVLNLPLPDFRVTAGFARLADPDALARLAERDPAEAADRLIAGLAPAAATAIDWTDDLAADLERDPGLRLADWSRTRGLSPETMSRGFRRTFGLAPARFRLEARARQALRRLATRCDSLAAVAADCGFADQPHMTRAVTALTGLSPAVWRVNCVQDRA